jgi:hypothetical protein
VAPHARAEIILLQFQSHTSGQYDGQVHIKTNFDDLVIPVELGVMRGGLTPSVPMVIFFGFTSDRVRALFSLAPAAPVVRFAFAHGSVRCLYVCVFPGGKNFAARLLGGQATAKQGGSRVALSAWICLVSPPVRVQVPCDFAKTATITTSFERPDSIAPSFMHIRRALVRCAHVSTCRLCAVVTAVGCDCWHAVLQ